jgi:hypothetical protein
MSDGEQEARIALLQEYGSNLRNWYNVLLGLAIVFFTVVQVRTELQAYVMCFFGFRVTLWAASLAVMASQTAYAVIRTAAHARLAESVVGVKIPEHFDPNKTYLEILRDQVDTRRRLRLGSVLGWILWSLVTVPAFWALFVLILSEFSC